MQIEINSAMIDYAIHSGSIGVMALGAYIGFKVNARLNREESLRRDYPPHRHVNGTRIIYPQEYQPSPIEKLDGEL